MGTSIKDRYLQVLQEGEITFRGEFVWGSNYTFLIQVEFNGTSINAIYKPTKGERPLWDFPANTLTKREVAAYLVSEALGWDLVPPTVYRLDAPYGGGSLQFYIEHDPEYHYFNFSEADRKRLRPVVMFDLLVNNADRKGSHILLDNDGHLWAIDHGICFHVEDKLRTVIWDFAGEPFPENLIRDLENFYKKLDPDIKSNEFRSHLIQYLDETEVAALLTRAQVIIGEKVFPIPHNDRRQFPWPLI
ncbi:MAG: SCO1664 family protein [Anaerolineales bacterium]|nr:SCO1664 family protein [Anaerolineales bacterium]